ncbi:MAG: hypothetical protein J6S85_03805 [Methanobrevibacter sp.]|nr:hypothetical protein [Methanobrevibacter sp.]
MAKREKSVIENSKNNISVVYEIGSSVKNGVDFIGDFYVFKYKELKFLEEFAKDLDPVRACRDVGYAEPEQAAKRLLSNEAIKVECKAIYDARFKALRMTQEQAAAKHLMLMEKIESDYDHSQPEVKARFANAMAKLSGDYLRAAGLFGKENKQTPNVVINLNISDKDKGVVIDGHAE